MKDNDIMGLLIGFPVFILVFVIFAPYASNYLTSTTGVCIYKGQSFTGGLFGGSSTGIPLRDIQVTAIHDGTIYTSGLTDRTGCFQFTGPRGDYILTYNYNGHDYTDKVTTGTILQDNLP